MEITGKITGIKYKVFNNDNLINIAFRDFNINTAPSNSLINKDNNTFAISKWVSPKRTRSYPFERVYNTLYISKKITVIPIVKDEGATGDRDFIQWDTISLMSLLDVFIIFAYYDKADKKGIKITNQQFDNEFIKNKITEIQQYHSSALHWNLNEINTNLHDLISKVITSYSKIENNTGVKLHNQIGLENFKEKIGKDVSLFMQFSREKAKGAQEREIHTLQPKESLSTLSKGKITISNYLGGLYFFTVDEIKISKKIVELIESKHSKTSILPSKGDIKDGLLKMILYSNLENVKVNDNDINSLAVLNLTSSKLKGSISSESKKNEIENFIQINNLTNLQTQFIEKLFNEANSNNFIISIQFSK